MTWILGVAVALILGVVIVLFSVAMPKFKTLQTLIDRLNLVSREILTGIPVTPGIQPGKTRGGAV